MDDSNDHQITTIDDLEKLYDHPQKRSLVKEISYISEHYARFIEKSPFVIIASSGPDGLDCSPRGDPPGFVRIIDEKTLMIPDRRGNNRIDTLRNLIIDPRISLLFLIPGIGETLRVNGTAKIVSEPNLCKSFELQNKVPQSILVVNAEQVYFQCQKALVRSGLWKAEHHITRSTLPSIGDIIQGLDAEFDGSSYDQNYPEYLKKTIY